MGEVVAVRRAPLVVVTAAVILTLVLSVLSQQYGPWRRAGRRTV